VIDEAKWLKSKNGDCPYFFGCIPRERIWNYTIALREADGDAGVRAALLLVILLAGCVPHEMTASEATEAANSEISRVLPDLDRSSRTIQTDDADGKWRVTYASSDDVNAGGPLIVEVDKRTRQAVIIQMAQ
jgi:hypothetical protein